jgi:DNA-binding response OmpR family regulator
VKILIVSGDAELGKMLVAVANTLGFQPHAIPCGDHAQAEYDRDRAALVVVDFELPSQTGVDLCRHIRIVDTRHETFVLAITSGGSRGDLQALLEVGADDYLIKPMTPDNIRARLLIAERRMEHESQRRAAEVALARARWLAGIGETSIALQHEINNPLTALLGHTELLLMDARPNDPSTDQLRVIQEQARRVAEVVKRLGKLRDPQSVEYAAGARMIDLSDRHKDAP